MTLPETRLAGFPWPQGKRAAVSLSFDVDAETAILSSQPHAGTRLATMTHQMFGPRVGVPRILDVLDRYGIGATFFIPGFTAERYPDVVRRIHDGGHEIGHHGYLHEPLGGMSAAEEAAIIDRGSDSLERLTGKRPTGFRAPLGEMSYFTPGLLAARGFIYDSSLMDDDRPYLIGTGLPEGESLVELPFHWSTDDWEQYNWIPGFDDGRPIETAAKATEVWWEEIQAQIRYGGHFNLVNHPFVSGRASRMVALERLLQRIIAEDSIWLTTLQEIAEHVQGLDLEPRIHEPYPTLPVPVPPEHGDEGNTNAVS